MTVSLSANGPERANGKFTPWGAFAQHRRDARKRLIPFAFEFAEWCDWWEVNLGPDWFGKRGCKSGQYVMARLGDKGPYSSCNVKCITSNENHVEGNLGKPKPGNVKHCRELGLSHSGRKLSNEHKLKISRGVKGKTLGRAKSQETKQKIRVAKLAYHRGQ